ncbi:MAG: hypothetical protein HY078_04700 [Elusimicrobia bacterium]|nr:hypothetical protein [Elusimicrobiota bacterium]
MSRFVLLLTLSATAAAWAADRASPARPGKLAGTVVRSDDWKIIRGEHEVEELTGNVRYRQTDKEIHADWARHDLTTDQWEARGGVIARFRRGGGDVSEARGERASYDGRSGSGTLRGKSADSPIVFLYYSGDGESAGSGPIAPRGPLRDEGTARSMSWDAKAGTIRLDGNVHLNGQDGESWSERAEYARGSERIVLTGRRPVLRRTDAKWFGAVQADRVSAANAQRSVDADGKVAGWLRFTDAGAAERYLPK